MSIIFFLTISVILAVALYLSYIKKLEKEFDEKLEHILRQIEEFSEEFKKLSFQYISSETANAFSLRWKPFFKTISKFSRLKKFDSVEKIICFVEDYKNLHANISAANSEFKRRESVINLYPQIESFFSDLSELEKQYITHSDEIQFIQKWAMTAADVEKIDIHLSDHEFDQFDKLKTISRDFHKYFQERNTLFIQKESKRCDALLSNIDGKSLDQQQRAAVINDENRVLVLAGAGSGKTLTIAAKVKYLCEIKSVNPNDILLISFTKKSAQEMTGRIKDKLGIQIEAKTFHKLGLDIIKEADGIHPEIAEESELNNSIHDFFEKELTRQPELIQNLTEYFAYYMEIPEDVQKYDSLGELYDEEKNVDLETIKSKYDQEKFIAEANTTNAKKLTTLNNEKVKSLEETKIANFLFLNGINYEYEKPYHFKIEDSQQKTYHPDFYLSDYDIYLEHFGITRQNTLPWLSRVEEKKYLDGIDWKRQIHQENGTKLIETYSYYNSEGILFEKLKEILQKNGVKFKPRNFADIFNTVYKSKSNKYLPEFIKLCNTFITLFKSNNYKIKDIEVIRKKYLLNETSPFLCERTNLFLNIIKILLQNYQDNLSLKKAIDFSDMINNAAEKIHNRCDIPKYKYIIVDEYQDISKARFNLLKNLVERTGAKLFCVGDDWQSIYRFAGSDISLFTDFQKYFGYTDILKIEQIYRNSQQLIDEASKFILKNPLQLEKQLRSNKSLNYPLVFWGYEKDPTPVLQKAIQKIVSEFGTDSSILLLGRTNYEKKILEDSGLFKFSNKDKKEILQYTPIPNLKIDFLSVHKSKGLEADNVIILNFKNDKLGFPNQIENDKVLNLVLTTAEDFKFAEERRLFYVAITRTRNRTFILTENSKPSTFLKEFSESESVCFTQIKKRTGDQSHCPLCKTGALLKINHNGNSFVGCSNFPRCRYTLNDATVLLNPRPCPTCGGFLVKRKSKNGHWFIGCSNYPNCGYTERLTDWTLKKQTD